MAKMNLKSIFIFRTTIVCLLSTTCGVGSLRVNWPSSPKNRGVMKALALHPPPPCATWGVGSSHAPNIHPNSAGQVQLFRPLVTSASVTQSQSVSNPLHLKEYVHKKNERLAVHVHVGPCDTNGSGSGSSNGLKTNPTSPTIPAPVGPPAGGPCWRTLLAGPLLEDPLIPPAPAGPPAAAQADFDSDFFYSSSCNSPKTDAEVERLAEVELRCNRSASKFPSRLILKTPSNPVTAQAALQIAADSDSDSGFSSCHSRVSAFLVSAFRILVSAFPRTDSGLCISPKSDALDAEVRAEMEHLLEVVEREADADVLPDAEVKCLADLLDRLKKDDKGDTVTCSKTVICFHTLKPPSIEIKQYLERWNKHSKASAHAVRLGICNLLYIRIHNRPNLFITHFFDRALASACPQHHTCPQLVRDLSPNWSIGITECTIHRLLLASLVTAAKANNENFHSNKNYAVTSKPSNNRCNVECVTTPGLRFQERLRFTTVSISELPVAKNPSIKRSKYSSIFCSRIAIVFSRKARAGDRPIN